MRTLSNAAITSIVASNTENITLNENSLPVRIVNDYQEDFLLNKIRGKETGFTGGYISDSSTTNSYVLPGNPTSLNLPPADGVTASIASTSAQDSTTGTGAATWVLFMLDKDLNKVIEIVSLSGSTPVALSTQNIYHFGLGFVLAKGSGSTTTGALTSNQGTVYVGSGTVFGANGFSTPGISGTNNYMWNRPNDGFVTSTVYVCPKGRKAQLKSVKLNGDNTTGVIFRTIARTSRNGIWSLGSEDNVNTGTTINRSLTGGFITPGGEVTVTCFKSANTSNVQANFVVTCLEFDERWDTAQPNFGL